LAVRLPWADKPVGHRAYVEHDALSPAFVGHQLWSLVPAKPDGRLQLLHDANWGTIGAAMSVSYDGRTIYFAMAPTKEHFYHIYRISAEGGELNALTSGPFHDYDPEVLPDGRIVFSSTRYGGREEYHGNLTSALFVIDADGSNIHPLTYHIVHDREPKVTADGGLVFIRQDNWFMQAKLETQIHHVRLDGSGGVALLGNDRGQVIYDPYSSVEKMTSGPKWKRDIGYGCPAPLPDGRVAAFRVGASTTRAQTSNFGLVVSGDDRGVGRLIKTTRGLFHISPLPDGRLLCTTLDRTSLGVVDLATGEVQPFYRSQKPDVHSVHFLGPRPKPRAMPPAVRQDDRSLDKIGYLYCQSVFNTKQRSADLPRIKAIRVYEGRPQAIRPMHVQMTHVGVEAVELGTAPIAADGSFYVRVPADRALSLQAVDAEGRAVITEMSWIYVRPGERRTCVGCHSPRSRGPRADVLGLASRAEPASLLGQGRPNRFRANSEELTGSLLTLQLDRYREVQSIDLYRQASLDVKHAYEPLPPGRPAEVRRLCEELGNKDVNMRISAARRLAIFRDRAAVPALCRALEDPDPDVRMSVALALSACGNRGAVPCLLKALEDKDVVVGQAANVALENLTGHTVSFNAFRPRSRPDGVAAWEAWFRQTKWEAIEAALVKQLEAKSPTTVRKALDTLGHTGGSAAKQALRSFASRALADKDRTPLPILMAAMRALGHLRDADAVEALGKILHKHVEKVPAAPHYVANLSRHLPMHNPREVVQQIRYIRQGAPTPATRRRVFLVAAAAEALGWIATPEAEKVLLSACSKLAEPWYYLTHSGGGGGSLLGLQTDMVYYRVLEALDAMGTRNTEVVLPILIRSPQTDVDRALLLETDSYEALLSRVVQRSGLTPHVLETCLWALGDPEGRRRHNFADAVTNALPGWQFTYTSETRAAQLASILCLDARFAGHFAAILDRFRKSDDSPLYSRLEYAFTRTGVCFYMARALGKVGHNESVDLLISILRQEPTEASFGRELPPSARLYKAEWLANDFRSGRTRPLVPEFEKYCKGVTPYFRAAAAYALGEIGDRRAIGPLLKVVADFDNDLDVRHAAVRALGMLCDHSDLPALQELARDYPEVTTRRWLLRACRNATFRPAAKRAAIGE